ncbi:Carboxylic ester hydrolase [Aphelenchoides fujianensis]|nr:Carboxylic ester hydrolase [Aphelenchoides fujianensis]
MEKEAPPSPPPAKSKWKSWRFLLFALLFVLGLLFVVGFVFFQTHSTESSATFAFRSPDGRYEFLGRKLTITDGFYFSGLPYAEAFRFSAAERVDLFMNETATVWPRECPSAYFSRGAEECLKLNIYRCGDAMRGVFLPVLVYVPEGEPDSESSANLDPLHVINNLACRGMVVVSVHYRQDVFSQFTLGERILKPNLGVLDVRAAIEWVHENIEKFFGDNSRVTVMGSKNGARILSYLSRVPQVKHLFSNMILVDGALESPQLFPSTRDLLVQQSRRFSNLLACSRPTDDFERMSKRQFGQVMACLRRTRRPAILRAEMKMRGGFVKWPLDSTAVRDAAIPPMNVMLGTCHAPDPPLTERNPRVVQKLRATLQRTPDFNRTADPNAFVEH